jgi:hypothetical protein
MKKIVTDNVHAMMMILKINVVKTNVKVHAVGVIAFLVVNLCHFSVAFVRLNHPNEWTAHH